ncbi:MAG: putative LytR family transcriptional protein [Dehalococcoidia bacterium]|nr:putative LytR family transcriptional protein [Dehalococcoidia bacterium]
MIGIPIDPIEPAPEERANPWLKNLAVSLFMAAFIAGGFFTGAYSLAYRIAMADAAAAAGLAGASGEDSPEAAASSTRGRVNVLILGVDLRPEDGKGAPSRTDTMMVASIDPINKTAALLSIPRDLWVPIPLQDGKVVHERINAANVYGELYNYPGGGPALARDTVQYNLGIRVHHYVLLDFEGFEALIDALGGVTLELEEPLVDHEYPTQNYGVKSIYIPAGVQHLNGERALWYARSRHQDWDLGRVKRQQRLLMAVRDRVLGLNILPRIPALWGRFNGAVETDMGLSRVLSLALVAKDIKKEVIVLRSLDENYVSPETAPDGAEVLLPLRDKIKTLVKEVFYDSRLRAEGARVEVLNGTQREGLAAKTAELLNSSGFTEVGFGDAKDGVARRQTEVILYTDKEYSSQVVAHLLGIPVNRVVKGKASQSPGLDIQVILGDDAATANLNRP